MIQGIDVSYWQGDMDWRKAVQAGARYAIIKATHGNKTTDAQFQANVAECESLGIPYGLYHYFSAGLDPKTQAAFFVDAIKSTHSRLYPVMDFERNNGLDKNALYNTSVKFLNKFHELLPTTQLMIYTRAEWFNTSMPLTNEFWRCPLWVAHYGVVKPDIPKEWSNHGKGYLFWQYSKKGPGAQYGANTASIDLDWYNGSEADFTHAFGVPPAGIPLPPPPPALKREVRARVGANIREKPSASKTTKIIGSIPPGWEFIISETVTIDNKTWVRSGPGWVAGWLLEPM